MLNSRILPTKTLSICHCNTHCKLWRERENQQDATIWCLLSTLSQHVSGIIMPIFRRTKIVCYCMWCAELVLLDVVGSGCGALPFRMRTLWRLLLDSNSNLHSARTLKRSAPQPLPTTSSRTSAAHHMQYHTVFVLLKMGIMMPETCWDSVDNKHLIVVILLVFSLSLHNLLTMHGHRNLKHTVRFLCLLATYLQSIIIVM